MVITVADLSVTPSPQPEGSNDQIPSGILLFPMEEGTNFTGNAQLSLDSMVRNVNISNLKT